MLVTSFIIPAMTFKVKYTYLAITKRNWVPSSIVVFRLTVITEGRVIGSCRREITSEPKLETQNLVNRENATKIPSNWILLVHEKLYFLFTQKRQQNFRAFTSCSGHRWCKTKEQTPWNNTKQIFPWTENKEVFCLMSSVSSTRSFDLISRLSFDRLCSQK